MNKEEFHVKLHKRIAQSSVGASAIRNQGKKGDGGLIEICRNYFETQIKLTEFFSSIESSNKFKRFLDLHTNKILALFPETAKS